VFDGEVFPFPPDVALTNSDLNAVKRAPTFIMAVPNPGTLFANRYIDPINHAGGWANFVVAVYGPLVGPLIAALYPGPEVDASYFARSSTLIADTLWFCPIRRHATYLKAFTSDVYVAMWNVRPSFVLVPDFYGITHASMVPFVLGNAVNFVDQSQGQFTPDEAELAKRIMKTVGKFMRTGKPGSDYPVWTAPETYAIINMNDVTAHEPLQDIRIPPAGPLPPPYNGDGTRCGLYDVIFQMILAGKVNGGELSEEVGLKGNFWPGVQY